MDKKIKRIIAREGLIFLAAIFLVAFMAFSESPREAHIREVRARYTSKMENHIAVFNGGMVVIDLWLLYLAVRFGIWAIKIIKDKE